MRLTHRDGKGLDINNAGSRDRSDQKAQYLQQPMWIELIGLHPDAPTDMVGQTIVRPCMTNTRETISPKPPNTSKVWISRTWSLHSQWEPLFEVNVRSLCPFLSISIVTAAKFQAICNSTLCPITLMKMDTAHHYWIIVTSIAYCQRTSTRLPCRKGHGTCQIGVTYVQRVKQGWQDCNIVVNNRHNILYRFLYKMKWMQWIVGCQTENSNMW